MRRFFSWVAVLVVWYVYQLLDLNLWRLVFWAAGEIYRLNTALYWILVVIGGSTVLGFVSYFVLLSSMCTVKIPQLIWKSKKGLRYKVYSVVVGLLGILCVITALLGYSSTKGISIVCGLTDVFYAVFVYLLADDAVSKDGPPPTKIERMEKKLNKLRETEGRNGHNA